MEELDFEMLEPQEIKVLVKINENAEITKITSSVFDSEDDYIIIDSGNGDKFAHAQNQYLEKTIKDIYNRYNYQYVNNEVIEVVHGEYVAPDPEPTEVEILQAENEELKDELTNTQLAIVEIYELMLT